MVIDPTMDMDIADMLSSGSSGMYQFQVTAEFNNAEFKNADGVVEQNPYEIVVMYTYSNVFTTKQGKSALELSYLTMEDVVETKAKEATMDYNELTESLDGGRRKPRPLNGVGDFLKRTGKIANAAKGAGYSATGGGYAISGGGYESSGGGASGIDKYLK
jgi:uncharacterized membrane protein YgcG